MNSARSQTPSGRRTLRGGRSAGAAVLGWAVLAATAGGCGSGSSAGTTTAAPSTGAAPATTIAAPPTTTTTPVTAAPEPTPTTAAPTTSSAPPTTTAELAAGTDVVSVDGTAQMVASDAWQDVSTAERSMWKVVDGDEPNIVLSGQPINPGSTLDLFMKAFQEQMNAAGLEEIDSRTMTGLRGQELAFFEYTGEVEGTATHFVAYAAVANDTAAMVTLTVPDEQFAEIHERERPYLETVDVVQ